MIQMIIACLISIILVPGGDSFDLRTFRNHLKYRRNNFQLLVIWLKLLSLVACRGHFLKPYNQIQARLWILTFFSVAGLQGDRSEPWNHSEIFYDFCERLRICVVDELTLLIHPNEIKEVSTQRPWLTTMMNEIWWMSSFTDKRQTHTDCWPV